MLEPGTLPLAPAQLALDAWPLLHGLARLALDTGTLPHEPGRRPLDLARLDFDLVLQSLGAVQPALDPVPLRHEPERRRLDLARLAHDTDRRLHGIGAPRRWRVMDRLAEGRARLGRG